MSVNIKQNGQLTPIAGMDDQINDSTASSTTTYSSNKINTLLGGKVDSSSLATVATSGSYNDLSNKPTIPSVADYIKWSEAERSVKKNILFFDLDDLKKINTSGTWSNNVYTLNGLTFTVNSNKTITVTGSASANTDFYLLHDVGSNLQFLNGNLFNGVTGGTSTTYSLMIYGVLNPWPIYCRVYDSSEIIQNIANDSNYVGVCIRINRDYTISDSLTFYPMIRLASIEDDTYVPYIPDNVELDNNMPLNIDGPTYTGQSINNAILALINDKLASLSNKSFIGGIVWSEHDYYRVEGYVFSRYMRGIIQNAGNIWLFAYDKNNGNLAVNHVDEYTEIHLDQSVTLSTSDDTTVTFTNANIHADSAVEPWASVYGLVASNVVTTEGQCVVTFPKQDTALSITARIYIK